jgi:trigger factor
MQITKTVNSPTQLTITVSADADQLAATKQHVLKDLSRSVKLQGFRSGKAPLSLVEKNVDPATLQTQFLDHLLNELWADVVRQEQIRPVSQPKVNLTKFVPFSTVEAAYEVTIVGDIKLPDYKKFRLAKPQSKVDAKNVDEVLQNLRTRAAEKKPVERAAKDGDEVTIDFTGVDAKTSEAISGGAGNDYPLVLGSNTFIPGFEPELVGLKPGDDKTFTITFPGDYGAKELQNRKVSFTVQLHKVTELVPPKLDDAFAATVGPFKTLAELKADVRKQLQVDTEEQARRDYESSVLEALANKTTVAIPKELVDQEIERTEADERQNLTYRGQTWQEHLAEEGVTEDEHRERQRPGAEMRIKGGLILSEVADREGITVTAEELETHIGQLKGRYQDENMRAQLDNPESKRELASRLLSDKTIKKLTDYASTA